MVEQLVFKIRKGTKPINAMKNINQVLKRNGIYADGYEVGFKASMNDGKLKIVFWNNVETDLPTLKWELPESGAFTLPVKYSWDLIGKYQK